MKEGIAWFKIQELFTKEKVELKTVKKFNSKNVLIQRIYETIVFCIGDYYNCLNVNLCLYM